MSCKNTIILVLNSVMTFTMTAIQGWGWYVLNALCSALFLSLLLLFFTSLWVGISFFHICLVNIHWIMHYVMYSCIGSHAQITSDDLNFPRDMPPVPPTSIMHHVLLLRNSLNVTSEYSRSQTWSLVWLAVTHPAKPISFLDPLST